MFAVDSTSAGEEDEVEALRPGIAESKATFEKVKKLKSKFNKTKKLL